MTKVIPMPTLDDNQRAQFEAKLVSSALSKVNGGITPSKIEIDAVDRAHARKASAPAAAPFFILPTVTTELGFETVVTETLEARGIYDLTRLDARKPEIVKATVKMLGKGMGVDEISECLGLDQRTVAAIRERAEESGAMPGHKEMTVRKLKSLLGMMMSRLEADIQSGKKEVSALEIAVIIDKIELLSGGVTNRTEVVTVDDSDDFTRLVKLARARMVTTEQDIPRNAESAPLLTESLPVLTESEPTRDIEWTENTEFPE